MADKKNYFGGFLAFAALIGGTIWALNKNKAIENLSFTLKGVKFSRISNISEIFLVKLNLEIVVINPTSSQLSFKSFVGKVKYNEQNVGSFTYYTPTTFKPRSETVMTIPIKVDSVAAVTNLWKSLSGNTGKTVTVEGLLKIGALEIPVKDQTSLTKS